MADVDISTNGDVEQTLQQSDNDVVSLEIVVHRFNVYLRIITEQRGTQTQLAQVIIL